MVKRALSGSNSERGSITVEASIVVPVVIFCIIAIMLLGLVLYQRALLQSAVDRAVHAGASSWKGLSADIGTGRTDMEGLGAAGLYWRLFENQREEKTVRLENYAKELLISRNILKPDNTTVDVHVTDFVFYKRLEVAVESSYRLPGRKVLKFFGFDGMLRLKVSSLAVIEEPAEFIRNMDFLIDIEKELEDRYPEVKELGSKTREIFTKIQKGLGNFTGK